MGRELQKPNQKKAYSMIALFACLLPICMVLAVCVGKYSVTPLESLKIIWSSIFGLDSGFPAMTENVVLGLRIPRIVASVLVGAALSMAGAAFQGSFKNPLVSPDFLGVFSGASVGASIAILLSLSTALMSAFAFAGGIAAVLLTMAIPGLIRNNSNIMLVLSGIIVGSAMSSVLGFIKYVADPYTQLASITYWTMGSFAYTSLQEILVLLPMFILPAAVLMLSSWWIDILSMGETEAQALGANVKFIRGLTIICATVLTAASVCICGTIGWVALIVPHFGRMLVGPSNKVLMPMSALAGGLFLLIVDTLTRTIGVSEMPVSILTGVIGAPFYCWLLYRQRRAY